MESQQELFEQRYVAISGAGHVGWSDADSYEKSIEILKKMLSSVGAFEGSLLELGCGRGNIGLDFARGGWRVTGIDFSPAAIAWANEYAIHQNLDATFIPGDLSHPWPFESESFDVVLDANCVHFFHGEDRAHFLAEAKRVLTTTGILVISSIVNQPKEEHWEMLGYDPALRVSRRDGVVMNNYVDAPELLTEIMDAGFRILTSVVEEGDHEVMWVACRKKESPV